MSYILDALKKAEQERGGALSQAVTSGHDGRTRYPSRWWPAAVAIAFCAVMLIGFLLLFPNRIGPVAKPSPASAKQSDRGAAKAHAQESAPSVVIPSQKSRPQPLAAPLAENNRIPDRSAESGNPSNGFLPVASVPKPAAPTNPVNNQGAVSSKAETPPAPQKAEADPAPLREAIKNMSLTVLFYSEVPSERMVFINGRKYREGDSVDGCYLLVRISMEGAELSYKEERLLLRP